MNRKVIILALTTLLLSVSLFSIFSCNKNPEPGQCGYGPTVLKAAVQKEVIFPNDLKKTISFLSLDEYKQRPDACVYAWAEETSSPNQLIQLLNGYGITEINNKENLLNVTIYYNSDTEAYTLKNENIYGFLILTNDDKGFMYTQVFQKQGTGFTHLKQFDAKIWNLQMSSTNNLAKILNGRLNNLGYAVRVTNLESKYKQAKKGSRVNSFDHQIEKEIKGLSTLEMSVSLKGKFPTQTHSGFESMCTIEECKVNGSGRCDEAFPSRAPICVGGQEEENPEPGFCGGKTAYMIASVTNNHAMEQTVNFRDEILAHSDFGKHFIKDLEYVGYIFTNNLSVSDALEIVAVMDEVIVPLAERLNKPDANLDNSLFITSAQALKLQELITMMRDVSDDALYQEILDEMSANVIYVEGKTLAAVYMDLLPS